MNYTCPVCAFTAMPYPPAPYNICPCCGTEFGVDDRLQLPPQLRQAWIKAKMPWFDDITSPPIGWSPAWQLILGGFGSDLISHIGSIAETRRDVIIVNPIAHLEVLGVAA